MEKLIFKTNLRCSGCVKAITLGMESIKEVRDWKVDLESVDRLLEVDAVADVSDKVMENVKKAGYVISRL
jgi:copper chaperone CopZ